MQSSCIIDNQNEDVVCTRTALQSSLDQFVAGNTENCPQRSADWYRIRQFSFGGSELANLMGLSKKSYISQDQFLIEKFGMQQGTGAKTFKQQQQMIMDWGTLFEPIHRQVLEDVLGCSIAEASMCRGQGILKGCHQSPDGLAVVNTKQFLNCINTDDIVDKSVFDSEYITVLFEQKSPYMRQIIPKAVPDYYIGQIKLGLSMFKPCDIACYSESMFRICTPRQWTTSSYNPHILVQRRPANPDPQPQYVGITVIDDLGRMSMGIDSGDLSGQMTQTHFCKMMDLIRLNSIQLTTHIFKYQDLVAAKEKAKSLSGSAFFCWKLVNMQHTAVERSQGFENLVAMYVNLGNKALTRFADAQCNPVQEMQYIREFTSNIKRMGIPLVPGNHQDAWYNKYEEQLIDLYQRFLLDDWQSFYVLLTLLNRSRRSDLRVRALQFAERARNACADDQTKTELLEHLLTEVTNN